MSRFRDYMPFLHPLVQALFHSKTLNLIANINPLKLAGSRSELCYIPNVQSPKPETILQSALKLVRVERDQNLSRDW